MDSATGYGSVHVSQWSPCLPHATPAPDMSAFPAQLHCPTLAVLCTPVHNRGHTQVECLQDMTQPGRWILHIVSSSSMGLILWYGTVQKEVVVLTQQGCRRE